MKRVMVLATVALFLIGSILNSQPRGGMGMMKGEGFKNDCAPRFERMQTMLSLTDEQTKRISDLRFEHQKMALEARNEIQLNRLTARKMMTDNNLDQEKLLNITKKNNELQGKIKLSRTTMRLEIYNMLDDVQKEKWSKAFTQFNQKGRAFHKQGRGGFRNSDCIGRVQQRRMR